MLVSPAIAAFAAILAVIHPGRPMRPTLTDYVANATIYVMEVVSREAASQLGVSQRQVQRLAQAGRLSSRAIAGRTVLATRSILALSRSPGRGRHWDARTVAAAAELLETGSTEQISGSQRSRLRARLRTISVPDLAYQVLGDRVSLWRNAKPTGADVRLAQGLTTTGEQLDVKVTSDSRALSRQLRLLKDADGETLLVQLDTRAPSAIQDIVLYAYADERTSSAARRRIEARQAEIR